MATNTIRPLPTFEAVALTPAQERDWEKCRAAVLHQTPFFTHILYTMMSRDGLALFTRHPAVPIAATDGQRLILNPDTFFRFSLAEQVFIIAHEVLHCVFDHPGQGFRMSQAGKVVYSTGAELPFVHDIHNKAADYVINDMLIEDKVGSFPPIALHDRSIGNSHDAVVDVYAKLFDKDGAGGGGKGGKGFDVLLKPGSASGEPAQQVVDSRNENEWRMAVTSAMAAAKAQGKMPSNMERVLGEWLTPSVDWREFIRSTFARNLGSGSWNWKRPNRRAITRADRLVLPTSMGDMAGHVCVAIDTSGSITDQLLTVFFSEMAGLLEEVRPQSVSVLWCDARVHRIDMIEEVSDLAALQRKGAPGGGGTDFRPVFEAIDMMEEQPEALVFLTDGWGSFPAEEPDYPTIWGTVGKKPDDYPFGEAVTVSV